MSKTPEQIDTFLKELNTDFNTIKDTAENDLKAALSPTTQTLRTETIPDITTDFNKYITNAMGNVNGSRKHAIIPNLLETSDGRHAEAKNSKATLADVVAYISEQNNDQYGYNKWKKEKIATHYTTGKQFGISYQINDQIRTINLINIFKYLTPIHVALINNPRRRQCAQDFLTFRDNYVKMYTDLNKETLEVNIPVKLLQIIKLSQKNVFGDRTSSVTKMPNGTIDHTVNEVVVSLAQKEIPMPAENKRINCIDLKAEGETHSKNIIKIDIGHRDSKNKELTFFGNIDISEDEVCSSYNTREMGQLHNGILREDAYDYDYLFDNTRDPQRYYSGNNPDVCKIRTADGLILNMADVIRDPKVIQAIEKRTKLYAIASKTLHHLKKKHAGLVFINGKI